MAQIVTAMFGETSPQQYRNFFRVLRNINTDYMVSPPSYKNLLKAPFKQLAPLDACDPPPALLTVLELDLIVSQRCDVRVMAPGCP
jgi:hypothetical protein